MNWYPLVLSFFLLEMESKVHTTLTYQKKILDMC